jgi:hypothetical protein
MSNREITQQRKRARWWEKQGRAARRRQFNSSSNRRRPMTDTTDDNFEDFDAIREKFIALCELHWADHLDMEAVRRFPDNAFWWMFEITDAYEYSYAEERKSLLFGPFVDFCISEVPPTYAPYLLKRAEAGDLPYRPDRCRRARPG